MIRLTVSRDDQRLAVYEFDADEVLIGRVPPADVVLDSEAVSRRHTRLERKEGAWRVADLGAPNGVFLHRAGVQPTRVIVERIQSGDQLRMERFRILFEEFPNQPASRVGLVEGVVPSGSTASGPTTVLSLANIQNVLEQSRAAASQPPADSASETPMDRSLDAALALSAGAPLSFRTREASTSAGQPPCLLEVYEPGSTEPRQVELGRAPVQFGSDPNCDVRMTGFTTPRFVATAERHSGKVVVKRLAGGLLGMKVMVDGAPVKEAELGNGDKFTVGDITVIVRGLPRP